jgi:hypothetical protein
MLICIGICTNVFTDMYTYINMYYDNPACTCPDLCIYIDVYICAILHK